MSSETQISCTRARLSAALELVPRTTRGLFKKSSPSKQQTLSTSSTLKERSVGTWVLRSLGLFSGIPRRAIVVPVSRAWERKGKVWRTGGYQSRCTVKGALKLLTALRDYFFVAAMLCSKDARREGSNTKQQPGISQDTHSQTAMCTCIKKAKKGNLECTRWAWRPRSLTQREVM